MSKCASQSEVVFTLNPRCEVNTVFAVFRAGGNDRGSHLLNANYAPAEPGVFYSQLIYLSLPVIQLSSHFTAGKTDTEKLRNLPEVKHQYQSWNLDLNSLVPKSAPKYGFCACILGFTFGSKGTSLWLNKF